MSVSYLPVAKPGMTPCPSQPLVMGVSPANMSPTARPRTSRCQTQVPGLSVVTTAGVSVATSAGAGVSVVTTAAGCREYRPMTARSEEVAWSCERCLRLGSDGEEARFLSKARLLDRYVASSVRDAVDKLNRRIIMWQEDLCIVHATAERAYYVLFRPGCRDMALARFGVSQATKDGFKLQPRAVATPARACQTGPAKSYMPAQLRITGDPGVQIANNCAQPAASYQPAATHGSALNEAHDHMTTFPRPTLVRGQRLTTPRELQRDLKEAEKVKFSELELVEQIGSGEFGQVFRGKYNGEKVAIKQLFWDKSAGDSVLQDLAREIESFRHLNHRRIVRFIGACLEMPTPCIVTEYVPGGSLHNLLHVTRRQLGLRGSIDMCIQIAEGVQYLHHQNPIVVHRDLKSLNIILDLSDNIKICDFGLTEPMLKTHIEKKNNGGSPRYMAPELFDSKAKITDKIDVWSMGCIFVEVFGGPLPYSRITTLPDLVKEILQHRRNPEVPANIPSVVRSICFRCFSFESCSRASSQEAYRTLQDAKNQLQSGGKL